MGSREAWAMGLAAFGLFVIALGAYIALVKTAVEKVRDEFMTELALVESAWRRSFEQVMAENAAIRAALVVHGKAIIANGGTLEEVTVSPEATGKWSLEDDDEKDADES